MDPISIIGLTIAVVDGLWKVGNGTADLISNYREFDSDTRALEIKIRDENNRTRSLRMLLFEPSGTYGGKTLFEQFDTDVQKQIHILLEEASDVLLQAHHLLSRRQGSKEPEIKSIPSSPSLLSASANSSLSSVTLVTGPSGRKSPLSLQRLRWSWSDKKRVEGIVDNFGDLNLRIHENIKLWCLGSSIGVDLQHLHHLESDPYSQSLGFDVDARLQIATTEKREQAMDLEINEWVPREAMNDLQNVGDNYGIIRHNGNAFLLEFHAYNPEAPVSVQLDDRTRDLVNRLANLLHQPKEVLFRIPSCAGWFRQDIGNRIAYFFNIPDGFRPEPISLLDVLESKEPPPSLGQKFWLALRLARCISQLQLVKWVHESFRSENVLFLPRDDDDTHDLSEPWVLGFEFSRPEMYFSHGHADVCLARDIYRHPERQGNPTQMFSKIHDIYALGVVLLEIGLWQPVLTLDKSGFTRAHNPMSIKSHLIKHAEKRLGAKMGTRYKEVVVKCLSGEFGVRDDNKEDLKLQQIFRSDVVDVLEKAANCI